MERLGISKICHSDTTSFSNDTKETALEKNSIFDSVDILCIRDLFFNDYLKTAIHGRITVGRILLIPKGSAGVS